MKKLHVRELSRNQSILLFDVILQHDWPIEQWLVHVTAFFGGKTKRPCLDLFIHWLIKQMTNTYRNHFSRSYENRSIYFRCSTYILHITSLELCSSLRGIHTAHHLFYSPSLYSNYTTGFRHFSRAVFAMDHRVFFRHS